MTEIDKIVKKLIHYGIIDVQKIEGKHYTQDKYYINMIIEDFFLEERFYLFSHEVGSCDFLDLPTAIDFINNPTELFIYNLAKFTNFFFTPKEINFSYSEQKSIISFSQDDIIYKIEKSEMNVLHTVIQMVNEAIKARSVKNPLFYSLPLGEYHGFILLSEEQHNFLVESEITFEPL